MSDDQQHPAAYEAIKVHLESISPHAQLPMAAPAPAPRRVSCRAYTVVLTATNPVQTLLDADPRRIYALVQAGGNDAVVSNNNGEIQNPANQVAGLPAPIGMILPYGNTAPTKIPGGEHWYAAAAAYPAQVSVLVVQEG